MSRHVTWLVMSVGVAVTTSCALSGGARGRQSDGGLGSADAEVPSVDGDVPVIDGAVPVIGSDAAMPTSCTLGAAGAAAFIPVETMGPGTACGGCHLAIGKPIDIAGTVYPTAHEPDLCLGVTDVKVEILDSTGVSHMLDVNAAGNFLDNLGLLGMWPSPWTVAVVRGTARRAMVGPVTSGDCNSCHTAAGANGAEGRILAP